MALRVKEVAKQKGVRVKDIAKHLGVLEGSLSRTIGKNGNPSLDTIKKIAQFLEVDLSELIGNKNEEPIYKKNSNGDFEIIGHLTSEYEARRNRDKYSIMIESHLLNSLQNLFQSNTGRSDNTSANMEEMYHTLHNQLGEDSYSIEVESKMLSSDWRDRLLVSGNVITLDEISFKLICTLHHESWEKREIAEVKGGLVGVKFTLNASEQIASVNYSTEFSSIRLLGV